MPSTTRHPAKKLLMATAAIACVVLTLAVLFGAGNALVYPIAALALASVGAVIYLVRSDKH